MKNKYQTIKSVMMIIALWIVIISVYQCSMIHANPYTNETETAVQEETEQSTADIESESASIEETESDTSSIEEVESNIEETTLGEVDSELGETETSTKSKDAFIVDGNATIVDDISSNGKHFYTLVTENGNVFYLIIDEASDSNNVYFLDTVLEKDLMALAQEHGQILETEPETEETESSVEETQGNLNQGTVEQPQNNPATLSFSSVFVFLLIAGGITIGFWYFATYRPRKSEKEAEDSDDDFEDDDLEDDFDESESDDDDENEDDDDEEET